MGKYSDILVVIEEERANGADASAISDAVFAEFGIRYSVEQIEEIIADWAQYWDECEHANGALSEDEYESSLEEIADIIADNKHIEGL